MLPARKDGVLTDGHRDSGLRKMTLEFLMEREVEVSRHRPCFALASDRVVVSVAQQLSPSRNIRVAILWVRQQVRLERRSLGPGNLATMSVSLARIWRQLVDATGLAGQPRTETRWPVVS